jgi:uncharacterized protein (TIGR02453 family)
MFNGFADADGKFFKALAKHNERAWFLAHKAEFERGWNTPLKQVLGEVREKIERYYPNLLDEPRLLRIYRDVRFSRDKAPYKNHIAGFIGFRGAERERPDLPAALYLHVGADRIFGAAGHYMMEKDSLERFRKRVADAKSGKALESLLKKLSQAGYRLGEHEAYKRVPSGYASDHPRAELLRRKSLTVSFPEIPKDALVSSKLTGWLSSACKTTAPLILWLAERG